MGPLQGQPFRLSGAVVRGLEPSSLPAPAGPAQAPGGPDEGCRPRGWGSRRPRGSPREAVCPAPLAPAGRRHGRSRIRRQRRACSSRRRRRKTDAVRRRFGCRCSAPRRLPKDATGHRPARQYLSACTCCGRLPTPACVAAPAVWKPSTNACASAAPDGMISEPMAATLKVAVVAQVQVLQAGDRQHGAGGAESIAAFNHILAGVEPGATGQHGLAIRPCFAFPMPVRRPGRPKRRKSRRSPCRRPARSGRRRHGSPPSGRGEDAAFLDAGRPSTEAL